MAAAYLAKYGGLVLDNGYTICAIRPGEKRPYGKDWEAQKFGPKTLAGFIEAGREMFGVGIKTKRTPGVDIDCYDEDVVAHMIAFTTALLGETLERVGLAPKTLLVYNAKTPFPKTQSKTFTDDEGRNVKLEVLSDGQQFVAFHIHPDTGKPYRWKDKRHPANTPRDELPEITQDDALALVEEFEKQARLKGWAEKKAGNRLEARSGDFDYDDPFISDKAKIELPAEEVRKKLDLVPDPDEHDHWVNVGMALYHQFDGSDEGLQMWHEWSAQAHNYDQDALDTRWKSFNVEGKKREPMTARYILKYAKAEEERLTGEKLDEIVNDIDAAGDFPAIRRVCEAIKAEAFDRFDRERLTLLVQKRLADMKVKMSITAVRDLTRYENPENTATPAWMDQFVYVQRDEGFYSMRNGIEISTKAFDATYSRFMLTKKDRLEGKSTPEHSPSHAALNRYEVPAVNKVAYLPGADTIFEIDGIPCVNRFNPDSFPEAPERLNREQRRMVDRFLRHMEHLFASERDRKLLLSWMAYIVQTNQRSNWCPIIQGTQGDGKTTIAEVLAAALGGSTNAATVNGEAMVEKYTPWAEGKLFLFVEEVRLHGENRYDVLNKLKTFITNDTVPIRRMNKDTYNVINTVNYMMGTNFKNALPIDEEDTRYFPIFSRWQNKRRLEAFKAAHPEYYAELVELKEHGDALRRFFLDYELHPEFSPKKRAPTSSARDEMVALNRAPEDDMIDTLLEESDNPLLCDALLDTDTLSESVDATLPYGRALNSFLSERGWTFLGRVWVSGKQRRLWTQEPERFQVNGKADPAKVKHFVDQGGDFI